MSVLSDPKSVHPGVPSVRAAVILGVGHVWPPVRRTLGDGQMGHEVLGTGTVPVLFAVRGEHDITGTEFDDLLTSGLDPAAPLGDVEGVPGTGRTPGWSGPALPLSG